MTNPLGTSMYDEIDTNDPMMVEDSYTTSNIQKPPSMSKENYIQNMDIGIRGMIYVAMANMNLSYEDIDAYMEWQPGTMKTKTSFLNEKLDTLGILFSYLHLKFHLS